MGSRRRKIAVDGFGSVEYFGRLLVKGDNYLELEPHSAPRYKAICRGRVLFKTESREELRIWLDCTGLKVAGGSELADYGFVHPKDGRYCSSKHLTLYGLS